MDVEFAPLGDADPGTIAALLRASYARLLELDCRWTLEQANWDEYDRTVFAHPESVGACLFLTRFCGHIVGFGSWDPRPKPAYAIIGHNCILPEYRGRGLGRQQVQEILRRFRDLGVQTARVTTHAHPFFLRAQRMYLACGFREVRRIPWEKEPDQALIEYEKGIVRQAGASDA
jgi:GNAT superfamily N-acetyltransferase